jgi:hypothetical protein
MSVRLLPLAGLALAAGLMTGCGPRTTTVTGKVAFKGKPVLSGNVAVVTSDNMNHTTMIQPDGTFKLEGVPVGPCKIGVNSPNPNPDARAEEPGKGPRKKDTATTIGGKRPSPAEDRPPVPPGSWFEIPDVFLDPLTSTLTGTIKPGEPLNIDIP